MRLCAMWLIIDQSAGLLRKLLTKSYSALSNTRLHSAELMSNISHVQHSPSTHYREKHRSTISLHQTGHSTFKLVGSAHRRSSDTSHSSEQQKRRSKRFKVEVGFVTGLRTRAGTRVWVGRVQLRVALELPTVNPYPRGGFSGFYN